MKNYQSPLQKFTIFLLTLTLCWTTVACGGGTRTTQQLPQNAPNQNVSTRQSAPTQISNGEYPVQQARYNDVDGLYSLVLLNTPPGTPSIYSTTNLPMAQVTPEEVSAGKKSYLKVENGQPSLHLTEDFKIEYVHAVTETRTNPQTGQPQTVVVREERGGFWTPFAGALAGNVVGNLLFRPQYYVPPVYQPGVRNFSGFGGYGSTYDQAVQRYQTRYQAPPLEVRNRQANFRSTGRIRNYSSGQPSYSAPSRSYGTDRPTGSGFGSSTLRQSGRTNPSRFGGSGGFGSGTRSSGGSRSRSGFGSRRR